MFLSLSHLWLTYHFTGENGLNPEGPDPIYSITCSGQQISSILSELSTGSVHDALKDMKGFHGL